VKKLNGNKRNETLSGRVSRAGHFIGCDGVVHFSHRSYLVARRGEQNHPPPYDIEPFVRTLLN